MALTAEQISKLKVVEIERSVRKFDVVELADVVEVVRAMKFKRWTSFTAKDIHKFLMEVGKITTKRSTWTATIGFQLNKLPLEVLTPRTERDGAVYKVPVDIDGLLK